LRVATLTPRRAAQDCGHDIFRSKGTLCIRGRRQLYVFQGVHETFQIAAIGRRDGGATVRPSLQTTVTADGAKGGNGGAAAATAEAPAAARERPAHSELVFIGRNLNKDAIKQVWLASLMVSSADGPSTIRRPARALPRRCLGSERVERPSVPCPERHPNHSVVCFQGLLTCIWLPLPAGWGEFKDSASNRPYYVHAATGRKSWSRPSSDGSQADGQTEPCLLSESPEAAGVKVVVSEGAWQLDCLDRFKTGACFISSSDQALWWFGNVVEDRGTGCALHTPIVGACHATLYLYVWLIDAKMRENYDVHKVQQCGLVQLYRFDACTDGRLQNCTAAFLPKQCNRLHQMLCRSHVHEHVLKSERSVHSTCSTDGAMGQDLPCYSQQGSGAVMHAYGHSLACSGALLWCVHC
jgi:Cobalamin synthesis protein cobW C-terminal domain/WW domain